MPNLKCLWLKSSAFPLTPGLLPKFKNLTSLEITSQKNIHEILAPIGPKLKELSLRGSSTEENSFSSLLKVLSVCPNLEVLYLKQFKGTVDDVKTTERSFIENLKLKKLVLEGVFLQPGGLFFVLFFAPLLEELILDLGFYCLADVHVLVQFLERGSLLQNLIKLDINARLEDYRSQGEYAVSALHMATEELARNMICYCPKLQTANIGICDEDDENIAPFIDLVKML